jgi:sialate O-acetylesterase
MVLQRNSKVNLWGWADPKERINLVTGWNQARYSFVADEDGRWFINVETTAEGGPYTITFTGKNQLIIKGILLGDIWLCSGQSNMEYSMNMLGAKNYTNIAALLQKENLSGIRLCTIKNQFSAVPVDTCTASWKGLDKKSGFDFSATALFYGINLYKKLNIPIGLINSSWSGSPAEAWTSSTALQSDAELSYYSISPNASKLPYYKASSLYNGMVHPLLAFGIKGAIWYQGESNRWDADLYGKLMTALITDWRQHWNCGDFPFYVVEIAPYNYQESKAHEHLGYLREAQQAVLKLPNTGIIPTLDIGDLYDIHPKNKMEIGRRLANLAVNNTYQLEAEAYTGPKLKSIKKQDNQIILLFDTKDTCLSTRHNPQNLPGFRISGNNSDFVKAQARLDGRSVIVSAHGILNPQEVRYAFEDTACAALFDSHGMPVSSFRTDSAEFLFRKVAIELSPDSSGNFHWARMHCADPKISVYYTLDGSTPSTQSALYTFPIALQYDARIVARAFKNKVGSLVSTSVDLVRHHGLFARYKTKSEFDSRYPAGKSALADGLLGSENFADGHWLALFGKDLSGKIKLNKKQTVNSIAIQFLEDQDSWIFLPTKLVLEVSSNGIFWQKFEIAIPLQSTKRSGKTIHKFASKIEKANIRYIRFYAKSQGTCPPGTQPPAVPPGSSATKSSFSKRLNS